MTKAEIKEKLNIMYHFASGKSEEALRNADEDKLEEAFAKSNAYQNMAKRLFDLIQEI